MATESEQPKKRPKLEPSFASPGAIVTFLIGPGDSPEKFIVHKEHACYHSPVLDAAFNGNFVEGQTQTYRIEDTSPSAFRLFVQRLYRQELHLFQLRRSVIEDDDDPELCTEDMELAELWVLADKMAMPALQNLVVSNIMEIWEENFGIAINSLHYIYQATAIDSPLRSLMVSLVAHYYPHWWFPKNAKLFPHDFLIDLARYTTKALDKYDFTIKASDFFVSLPNGKKQLVGADFAIYIDQFSNRNIMGNASLHTES